MPCRKSTRGWLCHHQTTNTSSHWLDIPKEVLVAQIETRGRLDLQARQSNASASTVPTSARRSILRSGWHVQRPTIGAHLSLPRVTFRIQTA
jgi:hypothetical protein